MHTEVDHTVVCWEQQPENLDSDQFLDWNDFSMEFKKDFTLAHLDSLALNCLEFMAYYQRGRSLDDYLDEFQDLISEAGYTDLKTIVLNSTLPSPTHSAQIQVEW